jgi:hypothetical protein
MVLHVAAALLLLAWFGIALHDFLSGERLLLDLVDEWRLARMSLHQAQELWRHNPKRSSVIVSLTTIPSRVPFLEQTLKSLLRQSLAPARIVLNLPRQSARDGARYVLPERLSNVAGVQVVWLDEDLGPATKLLPTLTGANPKQMIAVVDDDHLYPPNFIADLEEAARAFPDAAFAFSGWCVPEDLTDRATRLWSNLRMLPPTPLRARRVTKPRAVDILQGCNGYLVRPTFFDLVALNNFSVAPPEARWVDDVWISLHCRAQKWLLPSKRVAYQSKLRTSFYRKNSLGLLNRGDGTDTGRHNSIVLRYFASLEGTLLVRRKSSP